MTGSLIRVWTRVIVLWAPALGDRWLAAGTAEVVRYAAWTYIALDFALVVRSGYLRRRPHWTADSWRRYLTATAISVGALVVFAILEAAFEARPSNFGSAGSSTRMLWIGVMLVPMLIGACGLGWAISSLAYGDPARPFQWGRLARR